MKDRILRYFEAIAVRFVGNGSGDFESRTGWTRGLLLALLLLVAVTFVPTFQEWKRFDEHNRALATDAAPKGLHTLALDANQERAAKILDEWRKKPGHLVNAQQTVEIDQHFIAVYTRMYVFLVLLACGWAYLWNSPGSAFRAEITAPWIHLGLTIIAIWALALADSSENNCLQSFLNSGNEHACSLAQLRLFAQLKFVMLGLVTASLALAFLIGLRRQCRSWARSHRFRKFAARWKACWAKRVKARSASKPAPVTPSRTFRTLVEDEQKRILVQRGARAPTPDIFCDNSEEPKVSHCSDDFVGLALSGGGIRSATFNLGLLQGLHRLNLLRHVDYLATVSGGGYVGGFWSKWLKENAKKSARLFPEPAGSSGSTRMHESEEVRHLREFSNFLIVRTGMFETETWGAVVAFFAGVLPALLAALSVLGMSLVVWLVFTFYMACPERWGRALFAILVTSAVLVGMEWWWRSKPTGMDRDSVRRIVMNSTLALLLIGLLAWFTADSWWKVGYYSQKVIKKPDTGELQTVGDRQWRPIESSYQNWWRLTGIVVPKNIQKSSFIVIPRLYEPSLGWALVALVFIMIRFRGAFVGSSTSRRVALPGDDRTIMRLLGLATFWAAVATFWHIGLVLARIDALLPAAIGAATSGGLFALLRNWIGQSLVRARKVSFWERLKPYVPQVLAYLAVGLAWAAIAGVLININGNDWMSWYLATLIMSGFILLLLIIDPHEFGLHAAYRDRICRAYLGAANPDAESAVDNRQTDFRRRDDIRLAELLPRPLHLVCCAANNVGGDHLSTLSRGARSAVLSRDGVSVGNYWDNEPDLQLGSALTASAAAFNSNMGSVSMRVGPAVSFLMSALNLRLGLWVRNPKWSTGSARARLLPGRLFYREMAALTDTDDEELHLSDGAHFDNLGLYELVRRHCRYVIVSDCTADSDVAFDDFGNTARRIREDFGIEIEIDLEPMRPGADGLSLQHMVAGTIHYDGVDGLDKGILLYFKPSLTGDEPRDVLQYHKRNKAFPHESTGDQFYDEAQWESYRRLGIHAVEGALRFLQRMEHWDRISAQRLFSAARHEWLSTPADLQENLVALTGKYSELESLLLEKAPQSLIGEFFPELNVITAESMQTHSPTVKETITTLHLLLKMIQFMEDVWLCCRLDSHWNHPLNLGWTNLFQRWTSAPTFGMWWPVLKPLYGSKFLRFMEEQMGLGGGIKSQIDTRLWLIRPDSPAVNWDYQSGSDGQFQQRSVAERGISWQSWQWIQKQIIPHDQAVYALELILNRPGSSTTIDLQVALAMVTVKGNPPVVQWHEDNFFVLPSLWGSGIGGTFLRAILDDLPKRHAIVRGSVCRVTLPEIRPSDLASRNDLIGVIDFYKSDNFKVIIENGREKLLERKLMVSRPLTTAADKGFDALYAIYRDAIAEREQKSRAQLAVMVSQPYYRFLLAQDADSVVGFSISFVSVGESFCLLEYIAVDRGYRNHGVGSGLFEETVLAIRRENGVIPILLEVDSDRGPGADQELRHRRQNFYRRLGCRRIAGCAYILPLPGQQPPPQMDLFVHVYEPAQPIPRASLERWLKVIYQEVYGCSADDPRISLMLAGVADPVLLV
jgi:GNAT superfamily N-acetyltransferase